VTKGGSSETRGLALVALSTLAYGIQPLFGKAAYAAGVAPLTLLAWRYLIALVCLELLVRGPRPPLATRLRLWGVGSVFVVNSVAYFMALEALPASVTALLLYSYPVIVALLAALIGVEALTWRSLVAALAAFTGCALTAGGLGLSAGLPAHGVAWALVAAAVYAGFVVLSSRFGADVGARVQALHLMQVSTLLCFVMALAGPGLSVPRDAKAILSIVAMAVVSTIVSMTAFLAGMAIIGPSRAAVLSSLEVLVTLVLAFLLLGERLSPPQWAGAALILGAVAFQNMGALRRAMVRRPAAD
jgi:drug/metabolite transporter (DMT)-like permease